MKDITLFIKDEINPSLWNYIPEILPDMEFKLVRGKWCSPKHIDGTEPTNAKEDKCVITSKYPSRVWDNSRRVSKPVLDMYKDRHQNFSFWECVVALCKIVGIEPPEETPEAKERYRKSEERRNTLEQSAERQRAALFTPEGKAVLDYLRGRGWSIEEIQKAELGYISEAEAKTIQAQAGIGTNYKLSIPLREGGRLYGFKFRLIESMEGKDKYQYLTGTSKKDNLFNLTGIKANKGEELETRIVVVEGELDALHAKAKGIDNIVATSGGGLTEDLLKVVRQRGIRKVTLLFDRDQRGESFIIQTIQAAYKNKFDVFVAELTEETEYLPNGKEIHDVDEYLQVHSIEELQKRIDCARVSYLYLLDKYTGEAMDKMAKHPEEEFDEPYIDLRNKTISLATQLPNDMAREELISSFAELMRRNGEGDFIITKDSIRKEVDRRIEAENIERRDRLTGEAISKVNTLYKEGKVEEALAEMMAAAPLANVSKRSKYSGLLSVPTEEMLSKRIRQKQGEIETAYTLTHPVRKTDREVFTLPSGAITFIVAPTSHGKSTLLQNIALQVAEKEGEGVTLYFTFEEDGDSVALQMLNKFMKVELCKGSSRYSNNLRAINHYFREGESKYIAADKEAEFNQRREEFFNTLYTSGKLRIFYEDFDSAELMEAIRYIANQTRVRAVFIDYIQLLSKRGCKLQRTEELKEICKELKNLSIELQLPVVVAAQANREVISPLEMHSQKIAEAADLERIANKILFIWNTSFKDQKSKDGDRQREIEEIENRHGIKFGEHGKIYALLTKNRGGVVGLEAVFDFNGNTGVITQNQNTANVPKTATGSLSFGKPE